MKVFAYTFIIVLLACHCISKRIKNPNIFQNFLDTYVPKDIREKLYGKTIESIVFNNSDKKITKEEVEEKIKDNKKRKNIRQNSLVTSYYYQVPTKRSSSRENNLQNKSPTKVEKSKSINDNENDNVIENWDDRNMSFGESVDE